MDTIPFIGEVLRSNNEWAQWAVLLVDLLRSFVPESGHETIETGDGNLASLRLVLREGV